MNKPSYSSDVAATDFSYESGLEDQKKRWYMCVASNIDYFKGEMINNDKYCFVTVIF